MLGKERVVQEEGCRGLGWLCSSEQNQPGQEERVKGCVSRRSPCFVQHRALQSVGGVLAAPLQGLQQHEGNTFTKNLRLTRWTDGQFQETQHFMLYY